MNIEINFIKDIPTEQIDKFEDKVVYNTAVFTRESTKSANAYPYLSGNLRRSEVSAPISGNDKEYGLQAGTDYAKYVWNMTNVNWTNSNTEPQWYFNVFRKRAAIIVAGAVVKALKEI